MTDINYLRIPLYRLLYEKDASNLGSISANESKRIMSSYSEQEIKNIKEAITWAEQNSNHDFKSMLPNMNLNNKDLYTYLSYIFKQNTGNTGI